MNLSNVVVIIPVYITTDEQLEWFDECLKSVVGQGCKVSIHDDGSKVDITKIISKYYKKTTAIFSRSETNVGVSHARNEAVRNAPDNSLIFPLDCDDTLKEGTISKLVNSWNGVPLYPDVAKFGDENVEHYVLMEFDCSHLCNFVGYTSVNVLHSKEQWKALGGWNEELDFYEDGEYNARLFGTYRAKRFPEPLVNYRIHHGQRTKLYSGVSKKYADKILSYIRRLDMAGCPGGCGGKKRNGGSGITRTSNSKVQITGQRGENIMVDNANLPLEFEGKVLARYVGGKGKGKHYYQGLGSKTYYRNVQYGVLIYADPRDVSEEEGNPSKLIKVKHTVIPSRSVPIAAPASIKKPEPIELERSIVEEEITRIPKVEVEKAPVTEEVEVDFDDISKMSLKDLKGVEITCEDAKELLAIEEKGSNRPSVIRYLKSLCSE